MEEAAHLNLISDLEFEYRALTPQVSTLRLVHILPTDKALQRTYSGSLSPPRVSCTCEHTSIRPDVRYHALSYTWGGKAKTSNILLNGAIHRVTKNLEEALLYLKRTNEPITVWIDALCINQDDIAERSEHVQRMRDIYNRAERVICWIGGPTEGSDLAMNWIRRFGQRADDLSIGSNPQLYLRHLFKIAHLGRQHELDQPIRQFIHDLRESLIPTPSSTKSTATALVEFTTRPYWSRIWIVQEIASGNVLEFRCGDDAVSEVQMHRATLLLRNLQQIHRLKISGWADDETSSALYSIDCRKLINEFKIRRAGQPLELIYLILLAKSHKATEERDLIFALLNCAVDRDTLGLAADYSMLPEQVFMKTTWALLNHGYFDILQCPTRPDRLPNLPSWCRDYLEVAPHRLQERALDRKSGKGLTTLQPKFCASGDSKLNLRNIQLLDSKRLRLHAKSIGLVAAIAPRWDSNCAGAWFVSLAELYRSCERDDFSDVLEHICRTAVTDQQIRNGPQKPRLSSDITNSIISLLSETQEWTLLNTESFMFRGLNEYYTQLESTASTRRPFRTKTSIGIGPHGLEVGDLLYCIPGANVPLALRQTSVDELTFVGEVYLHGAMDGELADMSGAVMIEIS